ncbi:MAG: DUF401 family protein [Lachnospiraceae bacterium]|nr:DUF401 family protein [Lachnospiraceae bacterium]
MQLAYLGIVFLIIILLLAKRRPLYQAIFGGLVATVLLFRIPPMEIVNNIVKVFTSWSSMSVLVSLYLIALLQRMLGARDQIKLAQKDLNGLFHNRRINAAVAPVFIGLVPSAAAMILCGDIVKEASDGYLDKKEQAFVTSWFRHLPESILPTYSGVILMTTLSGVPVSEFIIGMIIPGLVLAAIGYLPYLRRLPIDPGTPKSENRLKDAMNLVVHLWTIILILILILGFGIQVVPAVLITIVLAIVVYRFKISELTEAVTTALEVKLLMNSFLVLVLKEFVAYTGILGELPDMLSVLPIPAFMVFALLFFAGTMVSGSSGIIALGTPLAFAALDGGMPLMVLLMCMVHAASQISPIHVCLTIASEYYGISLGELIKKTIPAALLFAVLMIGYYLVLSAVI